LAIAWRVHELFVKCRAIGHKTGVLTFQLRAAIAGALHCSAVDLGMMKSHGSQA
jgi:hypothetical protein